MIVSIDKAETILMDIPKIMLFHILREVGLSDFTHNSETGEITCSEGSLWSDDELLILIREYATNYDRKRKLLCYLETPFSVVNVSCCRHGRFNENPIDHPQDFVFLILDETDIPFDDDEKMANHITGLITQSTGVPVKMCSWTIDRFTPHVINDLVLNKNI